jgi:hypothetical protein
MVMASGLAFRRYKFTVCGLEFNVSMQGLFMNALFLLEATLKVISLGGVQVAAEP